LTKGEREDKERGPKSEPKEHKPKGRHKGVKEQIMFHCTHQSQEAYQRKEKGNLKA
jgi:hypothetical protein